MHWAWADVEALPMRVYAELVAWLAEEAEARDGPSIDMDVWSPP